MPRDEARDDTTRYLCAAAHLDHEFANEAIREFLVEDTRPVPASAGVDAAAVLGEAVAARTRRKLRDIGADRAAGRDARSSPRSSCWSAGSCWPCCSASRAVATARPQARTAGEAGACTWSAASALAGVAIGWP